MTRTQGSGIIVMGPFRSGTSLTCRILSSLGVDFGPTNRMLKPDIFNPSGYMQRADVRQANTRLIRSAGSCIAWPDDPERIAANGDLSLLRRPDLQWRNAASLWGIKDPRFCATLLSWLRSGAIRPSRVSVVHVIRDRDTCAKSLYAMPELARQLRPGTLSSAKKTIERYAGLAAWHATHLDLPVLTLAFEELLAAPHEHVVRLAAFVGNRDNARVAAAARLV
ncbi:MAG: sulfotransferase [Zoogloeaceae bacterium]|nr:sulfotransferase [Zoogloeaceae bacterium]